MNHDFGIRFRTWWLRVPRPTRAPCPLARRPFWAVETTAVPRAEHLGGDCSANTNYTKELVKCWVLGRFNMK